MIRESRTAWVLATVAVMGLVQGQLAAGESTAESAAEQPVVRWASKSTTVDVRLDERNRLRGALVLDGEPVVKQLVELWRDDTLVSSGATDSQGHFEIPVRRGGVYAIQVRQFRQWCRLWTRNAAPPQAVDQLLLVASKDIVRGQQPIRELFRSDLFILGAVTAAAIAIPVAIYANREDRRTGS